MIDKIEINKQIEKQYNLSSIGINDCDLILGIENYIQTENNIFFFNTINDFKLIKDDQIVLLNDESNIFSLTQEQFDIIKELIQENLNND